MRILWILTVAAVTGLGGWSDATHAALPTAEPLAATLGDAFDGDPVSLSTGLYSRTDDDLVLPESLSLVLTRTYRTRDERSRPFGIGASHSFGLYLVGDGQTFQWVDLILADGGRIHFQRVSPGTGFVDAKYEHTSSPTEFAASHLSWNGTGWTLDLRTGERYVFAACSPKGQDVCRLLSRRDAGGRELVLDYDTRGNLARIAASDGRWIRLSNDRQQRITEARDSGGRRVAYSYDASGHLARVVHADGEVQEYAYGPNHEMRWIREPDREIVNTYDEALRCVKQVITRGARGIAPDGPPEVFTFSYRTDARGTIVETRVVQPSGTLRIVTFNVNGYLATDTTDPDGPQFTKVVYARNDRTNYADRVTVMCRRAGQLIEKSVVPAPFEHPDEVRGRLLAEHCR